MDVCEITLLYYSAHSLPPKTEENIRNELIKTVGKRYPIISVTQKPVNLGKNICVGEIGKSHYNCYKQILIGLKEVKTEFVACCEDDSLYNLEHFNYRPDKISYNKHMWFLEHHTYWHKGQTGMFACIAPTKLILEDLKKRFKETPTDPLPRRSQRHTWKEPVGEYFTTETPLITLNYFDGLDGKKKSSTHRRTEADSLEPYGSAKELFKKLWQ